MDMAAWAHQHFWGAALGDFRLLRRLVEVASCIRRNPRGTLPQAIHDGMALKAAYRLLGNPKVTHEGILKPHVNATREQCREPGDYLLIEDTTALSFTQRAAIQGMGPLTSDTSQGLLVHTNLAARITQWSDEQEPQVVLVGVFGQQAWAREEPEGTRAERKRVKRVEKRTKGKAGESWRWGRAMAEAGSPPEGARWTLVSDRECDIFEVLERCNAAGQDWVIRAAQGRRTTSEAGNVFATVAQAPMQGRYTLDLRARPGVAARKAQVEVRAVKTEIVPPRDLPGHHAPQTTTVVEVRELDPPADVEEPIHWVLLTSWPCECFTQTRSVIGAYACRWLIEEYHKALKTGTHIEDSQLSSAKRIEALLAIHAPIAADLLQLKLLANNLPDETVSLDLLRPEALDILEKIIGRPECGWTNTSAMRAIARMGGYVGRKNDGPPGWLSIWRGWLQLMLLLDGYLIALGQKTYG